MKNELTREADVNDVVVGADVIDGAGLVRVVNPLTIDDELELVAPAFELDRKLPAFPVFRRFHLDRLPSVEGSGKLDLLSSAGPDKGH